MVIADQTNLSAAGIIGLIKLREDICNRLFVQLEAHIASA